MKYNIKNFIICCVVSLTITGCSLFDLLTPYQPDFGNAEQQQQQQQLEQLEQLEQQEGATRPQSYQKSSKARFKAVKFSQLPDYKRDHPQNILIGLLASCSKFKLLKPATDVGTDLLPITAQDWQETCKYIENHLGKYGKLDKGFFEKLFTPYLVIDGKNSKEGLFTGYYEPELPVARKPDNVYRYPLYKRPADLVATSKGFKPHLTRKQIEAGGLKGKNLELFWAKDRLDLFIMQIQGSGKLVVNDGSVVRIGYDGHNGYKYKSIGRKLIADGLISSSQSGWPGIRAWLEANPDKVDNIMAYNQRYVFFKLSEHQLSIVGAHETPLIAQRSMAVDKRYIPLGSILWVDIDYVANANSKNIRRLMLAQDTGGAIKGVVRGDFFWGSGDKALQYAGRMKNKGSYYILLPQVAQHRLPRKIGY